MAHDWFQEKHFSKAEELLNHSDPRTGFPRYHPVRGALLFRGQADAAWKLTPKAFRDISPNPPQKTREAIHGEWKLLKHFFLMTDSSGLSLPDDSQHLREDFSKDDPPEAILLDWPPARYIALMGLAQHHGLSTRLLDWSRHPFVAAYFAAVDAAKKSQPSQNMAIWSYDILGGFMNFDNPPSLSIPITPLRLVTVPTGSNKNLHAQRGVFLTASAASDPDSDFTPTPLESIIENAFKGMGECRLFKFTAPASEAGRILKMLALVGIDAASIYPGYDGVVRAMEERKLWRD